MIADLLYQFKHCMLVKIVPVLGKVFIEGTAIGAKYVVAMRVDAEVRRGLRFSDVLGLGTYCTVAQIDDIRATAVKAV